MLFSTRYHAIYVKNVCNPYNPGPSGTPRHHPIIGAESQARQFHDSTRASNSIPAIGISLSTQPHTTHLSHTMASIIGRAAFRATRPLRASGVNSGAENAASAASREADKNALKQGARKDPELYVRRQLPAFFSQTPGETLRPTASAQLLLYTPYLHISAATHSDPANDSIPDY